MDESLAAALLLSLEERAALLLSVEERQEWFLWVFVYRQVYKSHDHHGEQSNYCSFRELDVSNLSRDKSPVFDSQQFRKSM